MAFAPHGLIRTPLQQKLYENAHIPDDILTGIFNLKERETSALMEVLLYQNTFNNDDSSMDGTSGDWGEYKDVGREEDGSQLEDIFGVMKANGPAVHTG